MTVLDIPVLMEFTARLMAYLGVVLIVSGYILHAVCGK